MQSLTLRSAVRVAGFAKNITRNAVSNAVVSEDAETQPAKSWSEIPGPSSLPLLGILHHFLPGGALQKIRGMDLMSFLYDTYGPIVKLEPMLGRPATLFLYDAENCAYVLRSENWMPVRPGFDSLIYYRKEKNKGNEDSSTGLITDHNEPWRQLRTTVNPIMMQPKTIKLYRSVLDEVALEMVDRLRSLRDENNMIRENFDIEMNLWALESIASVALGTRLHCFDTNLPRDSPERRLIQCVHDIFTLAEKLDFAPSIWKIYPTKTFKKAMAVYEEQVNLAKYFIEKAKQQLKDNDKNDDEKGILEKLLEKDENTAHIMATDMLFAGVDTAANTMSGTVYLLAINPDKQRKLREELKANQEHRPYLKACVKESLRMMPIAGANARQLSKDYNIMGYNVPKNTVAVFCHQHMSRMEGHYPRPNEYIPERWTATKDDPLYHGNAHPFAFSPFGFGVRMCIGRRIAELEMETFLARVIENFEVGWDGPPPTTKATTLNYVTGPFNYVLNDVKQ